MTRDWQNKDWLTNQYITLGRSVKMISELVTVHPDMIRFYLDQFGIMRTLQKCKHGFVVCERCNPKPSKI
jgi:hypothetical protein